MFFALSSPYAQLQSLSLRSTMKLNSRKAGASRYRRQRYAGSSLCCCADTGSLTNFPGLFTKILHTRYGAGTRSVSVPSRMDPVQAVARILSSLVESRHACIDNAS